MPITEKAIEFLYENRFRNNKEWYDSHKPDYNEYVRSPLRDMIDKLTPTMLEIDSQLMGSMSRVRRDTRFTHDKSMYRENMWIVFQRDSRTNTILPAFFFDFSPHGFSYGCGYYTLTSDRLEAMRKLILRDDKTFIEAQNAFENQSVFIFEGESYKRDHYPNESDVKRNWLNRKNFDFTHRSDDFDLLFSDELTDKIANDFKLLTTIYNFFATAESQILH